jgi:hypothetical protein
MPVVQLQPTVRLFLRDETESRSQMAMHVRAGITPTAGYSAAASLRGAVAGLSGCVAERQQIEFRVEELEPAPSGPTHAEIAGVLVFTTSEPDQYAIVAIPAIRPDLVLITGTGAGVELNTQAPAIVNLVDELTSGRWCNPWGYQLAELAAAFVQIRP